MPLVLSLNRRQLFRAAAGTLAAVAAGGAFDMKSSFAQSGDASQASRAASSNAPATSSPAKQPSAGSSAPPAASADDKGAPQTGEGVALAEAALASAGHTLPQDSEAEVRKQLASYPGAFESARKFRLANGDAPHIGVTAALPKS